MNLDEAVTAGDLSITTLSIDFGDGEVLDERIGRFTQLQNLSLSGCPEKVVLPEALAGLKGLRELRLRAKGKGSCALPEGFSRFGFTQLNFDNPLLEGVSFHPAVRELTLWTKSPERDLRLIAAALPQLERLEVIGEGVASSVLPGELGRLTALTSLRLSRLNHGALPDQLRELTALRTLELVSPHLEDDVRRLAELWPRLEVLTLASEDNASFALPPEIAALSALHTLTIGNGKMTAFAPEFAQLKALKTLTLQAVPLGTLPDSVCELPALTSLTVRCHLNGLPPALAKLKSLRSLDLSNALNKGALVSKHDDRTKLKPLPRVLSELVWLEKLNLNCCAAFDAAPLRPLQNLKELSITWSGLATFEDVGALSSLEVLDLEYADAVKDLGPIGRLKHLRELNMEKTETRDLAALKELPNLKKLNIERVRCKDLSAVYGLEVELKASEEVLEQYATRAELRKLPPMEKVVADLGSEDLATAEAALGHLATWTAASSTRDTNAIEVALGLLDASALAKASRDDDDDDGESEEEEESGDEETEAAAAAPARPSRPDKRALPPLDACLDRHLARLSPEVLARLFAALFHDTSDDYRAAARIGAEVVTRGNDAAQLALVEAFEDANEYYDTGHRMMEDTVHDQLLDGLLAQLKPAALTRLVTWCSDGHFAGDGNGDEMAGLFLPALEHANEAQRKAVAERLEKYLLHQAQYDTAQADELLAQLREGLTQAEARAALEATQARVADFIATKKAHEALEKDLESSDPVRVKQALVATAALDKKAMGELQGALWRANDCEGLDAEATRLLLKAWQLRDHSLGLAEAVGLAARRGLDQARLDVAVLGLDEPALGKLVRQAIVAERKKLSDRLRHAKADKAESLTLASNGRLAQLRSWANALEHLTPAQGQAREVTDLLTSSVGHFEFRKLRPAIEALDACADYAPPEGFQKTETPGQLASDVGQLVMDEDSWPTWCVLAKNLHKLKLSGKTLERLLAQLLGVGVRSNDAAAVTAVLALVPTEVSWDLLAYNLACHFAVTRSRDEMLKWTRQSMVLGKSPDQFLADTDFAPYLEDADFKAILDAAR